MRFIDLLFENRLDEAKDALFAHLDALVETRLEEAKKYVAEDRFEEVELDEAKNTNIIKQGRITKIRRRIRRNTVKRIPATERLRKARLLKRSWKTTRRAKLRRTMLKRKMSMNRRKSMGLR
jgi:hypothetical protein